mmetsp:Transcript_21025/g.34771  ORF Transcript_21025/g.34771 Transcript_21025/m.34771 type:complete len:324 (+) Transcript_21025:3-974(+)
MREVILTPYKLFDRTIIYCYSCGVVQQTALCIEVFVLVTTFLQQTNKNRTIQYSQFYRIMSGRPGSGSFSAGDDDGTFGFEEALVIVAIILGFLVLLLCMRYGCNITIDLCILCDPYEARRTTRDFRDRLFPCFKRRLVNPEGQIRMTEQGGREVQMMSSRNVDQQENVTTIEGLLRRLSSQERQHVIETVFQGKPVKKEDLAQWGRGQKYTDIESPPPRSDSSCCEYSSSKEGVLSDADSSQHDEQHDISCSICLHDLAIGESAFVSPPCQHVFHRSCIVEWCTTNNTLCPYCRTQMMTEVQLRDVSPVMEDGVDRVILRES